MFSSSQKALVVTGWMVVGLILPQALPAQTAPGGRLSTAAYIDDFDAAWTFVRDRYAYFDQKNTDWDRVRAIYRPQAARATSRDAFLGVLEDVIEELYDHHAHLGTNTARSPRLVPSETDLWAEWRESRPILTSVRDGSHAEHAGLRPGMEVVSIHGSPVREVVRNRLPAALRAPDSVAHDWALRVALAGRHDAGMQVTVRAGERTETVAFRPGLTETPGSRITAERLASDIGYVRIHDALGDYDTIAAWDAALASLRDTEGLILDLRNTPSGGNTTVARAILGRLVSQEHPYQRHELPAEERHHGVRRAWIELVLPRGPFTYDQPVVALVGRWTGSMGEGMAIGLDALPRASVSEPRWPAYWAPCTAPCYQTRESRCASLASGSTMCAEPLVRSSRRLCRCHPVTMKPERTARCRRR